MKIKKAYPPHGVSNTDNKFRVMSKSPKKRFKPPSIDPLRKTGNPHLLSSKADNAIVGAEVFDIEDPPDFMRKTSDLYEQLVTPRDGDGQLNDRKKIGSFRGIFTMPQTGESAKNYYLKNNNQKTTGNPSSFIAPRIGSMRPKTEDITGHMNFGSK
jgi:hypothetical protein